MVVAEAWAEQRVLMRAYAASPDQTRPTIVLHGALLAIGPAGLDPHGPWGIHVEPPADGRAQALQAELEVAARRLFGSKGNPPRLTDEESSFDRGRTGYWAPGTPRKLPPRHGRGEPGYYEPNQVAGAPAGVVPPVRDMGHPPPAGAMARTAFGIAPGTGARMEDRGDAGGAQPWAPASPVSPVSIDIPSQTPGQTPGEASAEAPGKRPRAATAPGSSAVLGRTLPLGLRLTAAEHEVLHALGQAGALSVTRVAQLAATGDGASWMSALIAKLASCGLDLIATAEGSGGETMYVLRG